MQGKAMPPVVKMRIAKAFRKIESAPAPRRHDLANFIIARSSSSGGARDAMRRARRQEAHIGWRG
jgi:hypothetical protein